MLTRQEGERLAQAVHALRPEWPVGSLLTFIGKRHARPLLDLTIELVWVAQLPETKSPARIDQDGPWKKATAAGSSVVKARTITDDDCAVCYLPRRAPHDGHEWEPQHARTTGERMPDDIKAAIAATPKPTHEAPAPRAEPSPASDVLAGHTKETP